MASSLRQAAVIPVSDNRICMVTSSSGRRWVIPKGMIDRGNTAVETAVVEAWEEAGLAGLMQTTPIGSYLYEKYGRTYHVTVFVMQVSDIAVDWPERDVRKREWVEPEEAVSRIEEQGLREIVEAYSRSSLTVDTY